MDCDERGKVICESVSHPSLNHPCNECWPGVIEYFEMHQVIKINSLIQEQLMEIILKKNIED